MRAVFVVVAEVFGEHRGEVPLAGDQDAVGALAAGGSTQRSAIAFARGACGGVRSTSIPAAVNTASKAAVNFASRSRMRNRSR